MEYNGRISSNVLESCEFFADFFQSNYSPDCYRFDNVSFDNLPAMVDIGSLSLSTEEVYSALGKLNNDTFHGTDLIPNILLKNCSFSLCEVLTLLFNYSLKSGIFLSCWKFSYIKPLHKAGPRNTINNYRGIAKLMPLPKVFESLVKEKLQFMIKESICDQQHGFLSGRSTTTNLALFKNFASNNIEQGAQIDVIYTDFVKAFDRVNILLLKKKLLAFGIHSSFLDWIFSYLSNRKQSVLIDSIKSRSFEVLSGVPQGSHLGPLLFIIFVNDAGLSFSFAKFLLYADDMKIFAPVRSLSDCLVLQDEIDKFVHWCSRNGLELSSSKCKMYSFYRLVNPVSFRYTVGGITIDHPDIICDLGVYFDRNLGYTYQIDHVSAKAFKMLGFIKRNSKDFSDVYTLKMLYTSLVRSILEYASIVWSPYTAFHSSRVESVQRSFTRFALRRLFWNNGIPSYKSRCLFLGLDSLECRRKIAAVLFVRDILCYRVISPDLLALLNIYVPGTSLRTRGYFLTVPMHRTVYGLNEPIAQCSRYFNEAFSSVDLSSNRDKFKEAVIFFFRA